MVPSANKTSLKTGARNPRKKGTAIEASVGHLRHGVMMVVGSTEVVTKHLRRMPVGGLALSGGEIGALCVKR